MGLLMLLLLLLTIIVLGGARKNQCWSGIPRQLQHESMLKIFFKFHSLNIAKFG
jgi:hypothetical protein